MSRWQPLWLLLAIGLSAGMNHATKPLATYAIGIGERTMSSGSLWLQDGSQRHEFKLISIHVLAVDVPRLFSKPLAIREVWLRSPEQGGDAPDLELFVDFTRDGVAADASARDIGDLRGRELPIQLKATGGEMLSRVRLPGAPEPAAVVDGDLSIAEAIELEVGNPSQGFRVRGKLRLSLQQGESVRQLAGELNARLVWQ